MASFQVKVEEIIECPVCFNIPRELPVPSCRAGHIVCRPCKKEMRLCPTCRHSLNYTNTIVGNLAQLAEHKCSFRVFNCNVVTNIHDIIIHEKNCPERLVNCPFRECNKSIQLKKFEDHTVDEHCAVDLDRLNEYHYEAGLGVQTYFHIIIAFFWLKFLFSYTFFVS